MTRPHLSSALARGAAILLALAGTEPAAAVGPASVYDLSLDELAELVVTDSKVAQPHRTVTQKIEQIRRAELERTTLPRRNLAELLRYTAGQFVNPLSRNDANWGSYAGLGPKYNSYLLDGLPIDSFADAMSLDPWALEAVEVYQGPASVLYANYLSMDFAGNQTPLAGITNFILKDRIEKPATRVAVGGGSFGTAGVRLLHEDRRGGLSYFVGGSFERADYAAYGLEDSWLHTVQHPGYTKAKVFAKAAYASADARHHVSVFVHQTDHEGGFGRPNRDFDNRYRTINAVLSSEFSAAWSARLKAGWRDYDRRWEEDRFPESLDFRSRESVRQRILPADLTVNYRHAGESMLTAGVDYQHASYETGPTVNDVTARSAGVFLQEKYVTDRWVLRAGGRLNRTEQAYDRIDGAQPDLADRDWDSRLWSAGARLHATPRLAVYANVGTSFLAPAAKAVVGTIAAADAGVAGRNGQLPNPALRPEKGIGADLGLEFRVDEAFTFGLRAFFNRIDDAIIDNVVSATPSQSRAVNAGRARGAGFAVTAQQRLRAELSWFANLTVNHSAVCNPLVPDEDGTAVPFVPTFVANVGLNGRLPYRIEVSPRLQWVGRYHDSTARSRREALGAYAVFNLRVERTLREEAGHTLRCALDLNNLFDRRFAMPWQFRDPGFEAFLSAEWEF